MRRFIICFNDRPVGHSDLEAGDPSMGVAFGRFYPDIDFESAMMEPEVRMHVSVKSTATDELLICEGVGIMTSAEAGPEDIEVEVLGIQESQYFRLFPDNVAGD